MNVSSVLGEERAVEVPVGVGEEDAAVLRPQALPGMALSLPREMEHRAGNDGEDGEESSCRTAEGEASRASMIGPRCHRRRSRGSMPESVSTQELVALAVAVSTGLV